jgi:hypothetical protein
VTLALYRGRPGAEGFVEAAHRNPLPRTLPAGRSCELEAVYVTPAGGWAGEWHLDLINEGFFWFDLHKPVPFSA